MSHRPSRRSTQTQPVQPYPSHYASVPRSPSNAYSARNPSAPSRLSVDTRIQTGRGAMAQGVATGSIGRGYGPYSYNPNPNYDPRVNNPQSRAAPSEISTAIVGEKAPVQNTNTVPQNFVWAKDLDDEADGSWSRGDGSWTIFSSRGWVNVSALGLICVSLVTLFAGLPLILHFTNPPSRITGFNIGGINGSGQVPDLPGLPSMIDPDTPSSALTRTGSDGKRYNLVFSDEFNTDGRSFYSGDDPFWEAVDLHYWPTGDLEWYDPGMVTTANGKLVITMQERPSHGLDFQSGMLQSWNKLCFNTGYIEASISLPGSPSAPGLWPGVWSMGNLGRAGYGGTTEGMWPYSYAACDLGTFPNQTAKDGTPTAAATGGNGGSPLSFLPGQRLSACTCPGSDHPGPDVTTGRGVPEIDMIEAQVNTSVFRGQASQSFQIAPYNYKYDFVNTTPTTTLYDDSITEFNGYKGAQYQQAVSALTFIDSQYYNDQAYAQYGFEWWSNPSNRDEGYITWYSNGTKSWTLTAASVGPDSISQVSQRLIPEEPMYMILNLGMSPGFQRQDFEHLVFPSKMYIDYVRVYQRADVKNGVSCDPPSRPTAEYITNHIEAYSNPNITTWAQAGNTFPRNSLYDGC